MVDREKLKVHLCVLEVVLRFRPFLPVLVAAEVRVLLLTRMRVCSCAIFDTVQYLTHDQQLDASLIPRLG